MGGMCYVQQGGGQEHAKHYAAVHRTHSTPAGQLPACMPVTHHEANHVLHMPVQVVFMKGDPGDKFYIVKEGGFTCFESERHSERAVCCCTGPSLRGSQ
jgi:CRP-like cAMP-binding protein